MMEAVFWGFVYIGCTNFILNGIPKMYVKTTYSIVNGIILLVIHYYISILLTFPILLLIEIYHKYLLPGGSIPFNVEDEIDIDDDIVEEIDIDEENEINPPVIQNDAETKSIDEELVFINFVINNINSYKDRGLLTESILRDLYNESRPQILKNPSLYNYFKNEVLKLRLKSSVGTTRQGANITVPLSKSSVEWM